MTCTFTPVTLLLCGAPLLSRGICTALAQLRKDLILIPFLFFRAFVATSRLRMEDRNLGSSKYACKSVSSLGSYSTIYTGLIVDAVLDSSILKGKLTELVGLWPILGGDLIRDVSPISHHYGLLIYLP